MIGADAFAEIATWRDYPKILEAANFAVVSRPGFPVADLREKLPRLAPTDGAAAAASRAIICCR